MTEATRKRNRFRPAKKLEKVHWLYDVSIENIEERKTKALHFNDGYEVADFLGRNPRYVSSMTDKLGRRAKNADETKEYAIRTKKA